MSMLDAVKQGVLLLADEVKAKQLQRFFKTGKGEYAEGDLFIGVAVPMLREVSKKYYIKLSLADCESLLKDQVHELRLLALFFLCLKYSKSDGLDERQAIVDLFLRNTEYINNWDLVDSSAHKIIGPFAKETGDGLILKLADSYDMWENRIAMVACYHHIKLHEYNLAFTVAERLLSHPHDLLHKAVGWMLREIGKRNRNEEVRFIKVHYDSMHRTTLRYAIEKFPEDMRRQFLLKEF